MIETVHDEYFFMAIGYGQYANDHLQENPALPFNYRMVTKFDVCPAVGTLLDYMALGPTASG